MVESPLVGQMLQHRHAILAYIYAHTRDRQITEEIFQEVGLAITQHARQGTQVEHFVAWALEVAKRQTAAYFRAHQRHKRMVPLSDALADVLARAVHENERLIDADQSRYQLLHECLERLQGRNREIIELRYQFGHSLADIAGILRWRVESVKTALSRARKVLSECVERKLQTGEIT
ncbi:hypothetical protein AYO44_10910 [Planctomycetaceae bacterium SCGC AG-212-F19]|nr:hypothetical protein AYO44_10910 [Planctomycetaceae bacterium SCGC AG-212-F19]